MPNVVETLAVAITGITADLNSRVNAAVRDAQRALGPIEKPVKIQADTAPLTRSVESATRQANSLLGSIAQTAVGVFGGIVMANAVSGLVNGIASIGKAAIGNNAYFQAMQAGMEATFSEGAIAAAKGGAAIASAGAAAAAEAARSIRDTNERIEDTMADHAERVASIQSDILEVSGQNITTRQQQLSDALTDLAEATVRRIAEVREQISRSNADFADRQQERFAAYQEQITSLAEQHADRRAAIEQQLADLTASFAERQAERQENLQDRLTDLQSSHEERRANILEQLRTGRGGSAIAARRRLTEEDAAYAKQQEKLKATAAKEEAKAKAQQDKQIRALQVRLAQEDAEYKKQDARLDARYQAEVAKAQKAHNQQVSDLQARIAKENAAYDQQKAKLTADGTEDVARFQATNAKRLAVLQEQLDREDKLYARRMRDLGEQSEAAADKAAKAAAKPVIKAYEELSAMIGAGGFLEGTITEKERADKIIAWARQIALDLPGSVKDALAATQMAGAFNLDITKWLQPAAGAAATFSKPVEQVMRGIGALAAGRGGEAIEMLRDVGINLRNISGIEFDAQGTLITPLEKAMPLLRQYLVDRYGGALTKMQGTWANVTSNLGDMWDAFVTKLGAPVFEKLNVTLRDGMKWLQDPANAKQIDALAQSIGVGLATAFDTVVAILKWLSDNRETFTAVWNGISTAIGIAVQAITVAWSVIQPIVSSIYATLTEFWTEVEPQLANVWSKVLIAVGAATAFLQANWADIQGILNGIWLVIQGIVEVGWAVVSGIIRIGLAILTGDWQGAWTALSDMLADIWDGMVKIASGAFDAIGAQFLLVLKAIYQLGKPIFDDLNTLWDNFTSKIKDAVDWLGQLWEAMKKVPGVEGFLKSIWERGISTPPSAPAPTGGVRGGGAGFNIAPLPSVAVRGAVAPIQINYRADHTWDAAISEDQRAAIKDEVQLATLLGINRALNASLAGRGV